MEAVAAKHLVDVTYVAASKRACPGRTRIRCTAQPLPDQQLVENDLEDLFVTHRSGLQSSTSRQPPPNNLARIPPLHSGRGPG